MCLRTEQFHFETALPTRKRQPPHCCRRQRCCRYLHALSGYVNRPPKPFGLTGRRPVASGVDSVKATEGNPFGGRASWRRRSHAGIDNNDNNIFRQNANNLCKKSKAICSGLTESATSPVTMRQALPVPAETTPQGQRAVAASVCRHGPPVIRAAGAPPHPRMDKASLLHYCRSRVNALYDAHGLSAAARPA